MSDFKCSVVLSGLLLSFSMMTTPALAADEGHYLFGQYRYFGPKLDVEFVPDGVEDNLTSGKRFYSTLTKHQYNFLKNTGRTYKEAVSFGGWNMPSRMMSGFEYDFRQNRTSTNGYGNNDKSGSFFFIGDKAFADNSLYMGGGIVLNRYHSDYDNALKAELENYMAAMHAVYNNLDWKIRWRSLLMMGYGNTENKRLADISEKTELFKADYHAWYYAFENTFSKIFKYEDFYLQSYWELNGYHVRQDKINEKNSTINAFSAKSRNTSRVDGLSGLYIGYAGKDNFENWYNIKVGADLSYIFTSPYDAFSLENFSGDNLYIKKGKVQKDYITWKAYFNYHLQNGIGLYSDFRYYKTDKDSIAVSLGVNYKF